MRRTIHWLVECWGASFRSALEYRGAFALQAAFMLANNFLFLAFWALYFRRFADAGGWKLADVALCYGIAASGFGLAAILAGGAFELAGAVTRGGVDTWLLRPRPVLLQGAVARMRFSGFGDLVTGPLLVALSGGGSARRWLAFALAALAAGVVLASFCVLCHAAAFWLGRADDLAPQAVMILVTFSLYPPGLFGGAARLLLFTAVPAGLMSWLPAQLVLHPEPRGAALLALGVASLAGLALLAWTRGLKRYESGNLTQAAGD